ncbi:hypothetical protein PTSG_06731 [Salpingoeca rosetta]|uniref:CAP-Gly domain-containing protein n=1 Tax=Salpingoeca rosetta (strain ATCC 50818 / BSB-021) TaxID=946362 RepID=F2UEM5_SALR5|nr:uncharacterized protein PTSG_06731 [Salpingoeca rosetta]EGD75075.1 hypothetical protein PTSG_06731 [Salpingoeca rosetta]|eukprot:XP_004992128.1 hypothetical protein PTSG_06731 [Salpingoeca rosetta]
MTVLGRVKVGAERGTVRYVGQVQGAQGTWYGIEWDDPSRGKHDGSHKGVKYFACSHATGGSFVKEKKVNRGVSFLQALETRYGEEEAASHVEVNVRQRIEVELVGEDRVRSRIQRHDELREAQLRDMDINDTVEDTLAERCPNVNILDLSFNLICKWSTVVAICKQLPRLTSLNISGNRLDFDTIDEETAAFHDVTCLYLSHIPGLQWDQVVQICRHMPNLTELHACENGMEHINMDAETVRVFGRLHTLNMYGNALHAWSKVLALGELPALSDLKLNANQLGDCTDFTPLSSLASLSIASNEISSWETVKALGKLTGLTSVRMRHNPVGSGVTEAVYRKLCIHHLPRVRCDIA